MAKTYTYDDFLRAMEASGLGGQFSQADLNLARNNPDAGMSLLSYKTDYAKATTDEMRALANQGAEGIRSSYGGYTGGGDGGSYRLNPLSPRDYTYGEAPAYEDKWADRIDEALSAQQNRQPYSYAGSAPTYESRYDPEIQNTIAGILGRGEFSYDPKTDPVYSAYQKQYAREGQRATANAMGEAASMTGGMPSSWAMTAASQAGDYYAAQMADKIPELYQDAYNRYLQEYQMKLSDLSALRGLESDDYAKYRDRLSQYNTDREFDYATWLDEQKLGQQDLENLRALRSDDMDLYKTLLGQYNTDREFGYGQLLDEISAQRTREQDERNWAKSVAEYGDFSRLNAMGVDTSTAERKMAIAEAMQAAEYGDFGPLASLGFDTSNASLMQQLDQAYKQAQISSVYANMPTEEDRALERALQQARIASTYSGIQTEEERALDLQYKQAQIAKLLSGDTSSGGTGTGTGLSNAQMLTLAQAQAKRGDYSLLDYLAGQTGIGTDYTAVQEKQDQETAKKAAKTKVSGADDLEARFEDIREQKALGNPEVATRAQVETIIKQIPGYSDKVYKTQKDAFLNELFPPAAASKTTAATSKPRTKTAGTVISQT